MYRSIMVPLDGSVFSEHALPLALSVARHAGAALQLAHIHTAASPLYDATGLPSLDGQRDLPVQKHEHAYLAGIAQRLATTWNLTVTTTLLEEQESIATALHHHALASDVDLVVIATHARSGVARLWLGSVADALVRQALMPVLLVRPHIEVLDLLDLRREELVKQILIPLDGSPLAEDILEPAVALGMALQTECTLLQAIDPVMADDAADTLAIACAYLERVAEQVRAKGLVVRTSVVNGPAAAAILAYGHQHPIHLIAMATHARKGIPRLLLGSVAENVVRCARVPVLLHRRCGAAPEHHTAISARHCAQRDEA
jgi:nucleotide-binding universal stress UspA family protein